MTTLEDNQEVNFDGLAGPTHHYGGLSFGNLASEHSAFQISNPQAGALQSLDKMALVMNLNLAQAVLPPHERPNIAVLRQLGFSGKDERILHQVYHHHPALFLSSFSSSFMWTANSATVAPSIDSEDGKLHFTIANLNTFFHRAQEAPFTYKVFNKIFSNADYFQVHPPLISTPQFSDEGAANHNRMCLNFKEPGMHLFVYGRLGFENILDTKRNFPRQTKAASEALSRVPNLNEAAVLLAKQNPLAIDAGVFHNDVISLAHQNVFLYHELAFENTAEIITLLQNHCPFELNLLPISKSELSLAQAVKTYLFNSQLLTVSENKMFMIAAKECEEDPHTKAILDRILHAPTNPIQAVEYVDLSQSMQNGGGPACLRLRVLMTAAERSACHAGIFLNESLFQQLRAWILKHYRDRLEIKDLLDPDLIRESQTALDELTQILNLGSLYSFQKAK